MGFGTTCLVIACCAPFSCGSVMVSLGQYKYNYWADDWVRCYMGLMHWFSPTGLSIIPGILCLHPAPQRLVVNYALLECVAPEMPRHPLQTLIFIRQQMRCRTLLPPSTFRPTSAPGHLASHVNNMHVQPTINHMCCGLTLTFDIRPLSTTPTFQQLLQFCILHKPGFWLPQCV